MASVRWPAGRHRHGGQAAGKMDRLHRTGINSCGQRLFLLCKSRSRLRLRRNLIDRDGDLLAASSRRAAFCAVHAGRRRRPGGVQASRRRAGRRFLLLLLLPRIHCRLRSVSGRCSLPRRALARESRCFGFRRRRCFRAGPFGVFDCCRAQPASRPLQQTLAADGWAPCPQTFA